MAKSKILQTVVSVAGNIDPSLGKAVKGATSHLDKINIKALAVAAAVGVAAISAVKAFKKLGESFDKASDSIRIGTGATGKALAALNRDFDEVYKSVPTTMEDVSKAIAGYNRRLDISGTNLQELSKNAILASGFLGDDLSGVIEESAGAFKQWDIEADRMSGTMDYVFKVSQSTGIGFTDLFSKMQKFGPQLQSMGYSFETAATLIGQMEKEGVNTDEALAAMKKSVVQLAKEGLSAADGLEKYQNQIASARSETEAINIATQVFGAKGGVAIAKAVRKGTFNVTELTKSLELSNETLQKAAEDTDNYSEKWQVLKQQMQVALKPVANNVFNSLNDILPSVQAILEELMPVVIFITSKVIPAAVGLLKGVISKIAAFVGWISKSELALKIIGVAFAVIIGLLIAYKVQMIVATIVTKLLGAAMTIGPLAAIIALITVLVLLIQNWDTVVGALKTGGQAIMDFFAMVANFLGNVFKIPLNWIIDGINLFISGLNLLKIPDWVPVVGGMGIDIPLIPRLAKGGFTDGISIAGEAGTEAVISFDPSVRKQNLNYWAQAGEMLGVSDSDTLTSLTNNSGGVVYDIGGIQFAPHIEVHGNANTDEIIDKLKDEENEFLDYLESLKRKRKKARYAAGVS